MANLMSSTLQSSIIPWDAIGRHRYNHHRELGVPAVCTSLRAAVADRGRYMGVETMQNQVSSEIGGKPVTCTAIISLSRMPFNGTQFGPGWGIWGGRRAKTT